MQHSEWSQPVFIISRFKSKDKVQWESERFANWKISVWTFLKQILIHCISFWSSELEISFSWLSTNKQISSEKLKTFLLPKIIKPSEHFYIKKT